MAGAQLGLEELELEEQSRLEEPVLERVSGQMTREDAAIIAGLLADVMTAETMLKRQVKEDQTQLEKWSGASSTTQVSSSSPPSFTQNPSLVGEVCRFYKPCQACNSSTSYKCMGAV